MRIPEPGVSVGSFAEVCREDLAGVGGGGFLGELFKPMIFDIGAGVGGKQLASKIFGAKTTAQDIAVGTAQMKKFLVGGNKMPKGVPSFLS